MKKEKFIKDFETFVLKNQVKKPKDDFDKGYVTGQRDILEDLKVWLRDEPGETINEYEAEFYKYFYVIDTGDGGYASFHVVFLFNGEYCRLQAEIEPHWCRTKPKISLSILHTSDKGKEKWKREDKRIQEWNISAYNSPYLEVALTIDGVALELWVADNREHVNVKDLHWRSNFDSRTDTVIAVEEDNFNEKHFHIVYGDIFHTLVWKGRNSGEGHTSHKSLKVIRNYLRKQGYDTRLRQESFPFSLGLEEVWIKG